MDEGVIQQRATPVLTDIFILYGEESLWEKKRIGGVGILKKVITDLKRRCGEL